MQRVELGEAQPLEDALGRWRAAIERREDSTAAHQLRALVWEPIARVTVPYAYTRQNASAELGWDLARATRLGLSFERERWNRFLIQDLRNPITVVTAGSFRSVGGVISQVTAFSAVMPTS